MESLNLYLGTYSGSVVNLSIPFKKNQKTNQCSFKSSDLPIKTIIIQDKEYIFVSGTDEIIRIYNTKTMEEKGLFMSYSGSISQMKIFKNTLFTSCEQNIEIFKLKDFSKVQTLSAHKNGINSFVIHPSGKLMFTAGRDNYIMMWNLNSYKSSFRYKFSGLEILSLKWFLKEKYLLIAFVNKIIILDYTKDSDNFEEWVIIDHKIHSTFDNPCKIVDVRVFKEKMIVIFKSNFDIEIMKFDEIISKETLSVKSITLDAIDNYDKESNIRLKLADLSSGKFNFLISVSSNNEINIYDLTKIIKSLYEMEEDEESLNRRAKAYRKVNLLVDRFTCLAVNQK